MRFMPAELALPCFRDRVVVSIDRHEINQDAREPGAGVLGCPRVVHVEVHESIASVHLDHARLFFKAHRVAQPPCAPAR